jgi:hypothetical protein
MYCEDSYATDIDHFRPKAAYPAMCFDWLNYLLACSHCNSNRKRNRFPLDSSGGTLLLNPADDQPDLHLILAPSTGEYVPVTDRGTTSIDVFGLNRSVCVRGRRDAWIVAIELVRGYGAAIQEGDVDRAVACQTALSQQPFAAVRTELARRHAAQDALVPAEVSRVLSSHASLLA